MRYLIMFVTLVCVMRLTKPFIKNCGTLLKANVGNTKRAKLLLRDPKYVVIYILVTPLEKSTAFLQTLLSALTILCYF